MADFHQVQRIDMYSRTRKAQVVRCRQLAIGLIMKIFPPLSFSQVAKIFSDTWDHTIVRHHYLKCEFNCGQEEKFRDTYKVLLDQLNYKIHQVEISKVKQLIERCRFVFADEKELQAQIERVLHDNGIKYLREHRLSEHDIPDFFLEEEGVVIEVKVKQSKRKIYAQCMRYAAYDKVTQVLLVTAGSIGNVLLHGKPLTVVNLNRAWL